MFHHVQKIVDKFYLQPVRSIHLVQVMKTNHVQTTQILTMNALRIATAVEQMMAPR